ncbi:MAG TPA: hypothetical protein VFA49_16205, partial [Chloroflexota bacterium]|nr:hypothetical protein [Chloroflexota bacterium]
MSVGAFRVPRWRVAGPSFRDAITRRATRNALTRNALTHLILLLGAAAMLLPFVWMISTSVKPPDQLFTVPPTWIPHTVVLDTYAKAMGAGNFGRYAMNSLILAVANVITNVGLSALAGYAFA